MSTVREWRPHTFTHSYKFKCLTSEVMRKWFSSLFLSHSQSSYPLFFLTIPLCLAILTCLLNRRLKSLSKALALVFKWVERETHSHCHIFSSSLHYSMFCVIFLSASLSPTSFFFFFLSADPFAKSYANQNNCFPLVASLLLCLWGVTVFYICQSSDCVI